MEKINPYTKEACEKKQFLMKALMNGNLSQKKFDAEIPELEAQIREGTEKYLEEHKEEFKHEIIKAKNEIIHDGSFKRAMAELVIEYFGASLTHDELKGLFRQGYKIMRSK